MGQIIGPGQLALYLQHSVRADTEVIAIRLAEGWLRSVTTSLTTWPPDPLPEDLWAWALELAGVAYNNPQGLSSRTTDEETRVWSVERRKQILGDAKHAYGGARPSGASSFPIALDWPDGPVIYSPITE